MMKISAVTKLFGDNKTVKSILKRIRLVKMDIRAMMESSENKKNNRFRYDKFIRLLS